MRALIVFALAVAAVAAYPENIQRIIGGSETTIDVYPSIAALLFSWGTTGHFQACGGSVLNNRAILTAAHCTVGDAAVSWQTRVGSTNANRGGYVYTTSLIINHPNYNSPARFDNDIAILRLASNIAFSNVIQPASIAGSNYNLADDQVVWAAGWGTTESGALSEQLRHVQIWIVNQATCRNNYGAQGWAVTDNMLCSGWLGVGGRDQCQGDSGGPLYHNGVVVGVCSWGIGCAHPTFPGVNARVSRYTAWIQANA